MAFIWPSVCSISRTISPAILACSSFGGSERLSVPLGNHGVQLRTVGDLQMVAID
jgi:hypothetical protein